MNNVLEEINLLETALDTLTEELTPLYTVPCAQGGHDLPHVTRMLAMAHEVCELIEGVNVHVFGIAVWLHNADRVPYFQMCMKSSGTSFAQFLSDKTTRLGLPTDITEEIVSAVLQHSKKDDEPSDSPLLQALRLADKWDRIGLFGALSGFEWLGCKLPSYNPEHPYGYGSTAEGEYKTLYQNLFRIVEWYGMSAPLRVLVGRHPWKMEALLAFIRGYGHEISQAHGLENKVEADIEKALGDYYSLWHPRYSR